MRRRDRERQRGVRGVSPRQTQRAAWCHAPPSPRLAPALESSSAQGVAARRARAPCGFRKLRRDSQALLRALELVERLLELRQPQALLLHHLRTRLPEEILVAQLLPRPFEVVEQL